MSEPPSPFTVRQAAPEDAPAVAALCRSLTFRRVGEAELFGMHWICLEKRCGT